jgi:hypothetical protein
MFELDQEQDQEAQARMAALEARIVQLEGALSRLLGNHSLMPSAEHFAKTQKLPKFEPEVEAAQGASGLGITAAFATLDYKVAEEAQAQSRMRRAPNLAPVVRIDPSLIDDPFAPRPAPVRQVRQEAGPVIRRSSIEELHPSILRRVSELWRQPECAEYIRKLIVSDRGERAGFDPSVLKELQFLEGMLNLDLPGGNRFSTGHA